MKTTLEKEQSKEKDKLKTRRLPVLESGEGVKFQKTITINRPLSDVYSFWRNFENLPSFMKHLESVQVKDDRTSRWQARVSDKTTLDWDAEIIEDRVDEIISWRSLPDAEVQNAGSIWFYQAPGNRGTYLKVTLKYSPPGGKFAAGIAKIFGKDPKAMIEDDLFRLKAILETGEAPTIEGQPKGK